MTQPLLQTADLRGSAALPADVRARLQALAEAWTPVTYPTPHPGREAWLAALNGVLGDHLASCDSPLAIPMAFRQAGRTLVLERHALRMRLDRTSPRLLVLLHGLGLNDLQWQRAGHDHGALLARQLGYAAVHLHYNSGLSVSTNGRILAPLLEVLYSAWPVPIERLVLLGHGMGGLVARSAIHHGAFLQRGGLRWPGRLQDLVCLGTPHQGTPVAQVMPDTALQHDAPAQAADLLRPGRSRSAGINDLVRGNVLRGAAGEDAARADPVPLPEQTRCHAVAASLGPAADNARSKRAGDGVVPVASALGQHEDAAYTLHFDPERCALVPATGHLDLLSSEAVAALLLRWLA